MALAACSVSLVVTVVVVIISIINNVKSGNAATGSFKYFTVLSNILTALASSFIIPFAINGIRKKRFVMPKWLSMMHYAGVTCITLVFIFNLGFILPYSKQDAIGGNNLFLHIICPIAVVLSFFLVESGYRYTKKEIAICMIPFMIYSFVYVAMVVFVGEENGGWPDLYMLNTLQPAYISFPLVWGMMLLIAFVIRKVSDLLRKRRTVKMFEAWGEDTEPVEVKVEMYGLGRYYGLSGDKNNLSVPFDILEDVAERFNMKTEELYEAYVKGLLNGIKERGN